MQLIAPYMVWDAASFARAEWAINRADVNHVEIVSNFPAMTCLYTLMRKRGNAMEPVLSIVVLVGGRLDKKVMAAVIKKVGGRKNESE